MSKYQLPCYLLFLFTPGLQILSRILACFNYESTPAQTVLGPSPCTSKSSSVPPKLTPISWVKVGRDTVNFIYCVNVPAPPNFYQTEYKSCCTIKVKMYRKWNTNSISKRYETDSVTRFIKKIAMRKVNTLIYSN